jgi:hypothetical protein
VCDLGVFDLHSVDDLGEVRRRTLHLDRVADREVSVQEPDGGDADLPIEMEDLADFHPIRHKARRGCSR